MRARAGGARGARTSARTAALPALLLAASLAGVGGAAAAEPGWTLQAGWGSAQHRDAVGLANGNEVFIALERARRPWLLMGAEAAHASFGTGGAAGATTPGMTRLAFRVRVQDPAGPAVRPFVAAALGAGVMGWGGFGTAGSGGAPPPGALAARDEDEGEEEGDEGGEGRLALTASLGCGVKAVLPGAWPDLELGLHEVLWSTRPGLSFLEPRIAVSF